MSKNEKNCINNDGEKLYTSKYYDDRKKNVINIIQSINNELKISDQFEFNQYLNFIVELAVQNNSIFTDVLLSNLSEHNKKEIIKDIYDNFKKENNNIERTVYFNDNYSEKINHYIFMIKVTFFIVLSLVILLLFNKFKLFNIDLLLSNFILLIIISFFLFIIFIFISLNIVTINNKYTNINIYNKDLKKIEDNISDFSDSISHSCSGADCCDDDMLYNSKTNKCEFKK